MINGSLDAQYVELQGVVTAVVEPFLLTLLTPAGKYNVGLYETPATDWSRFENALVRIKGCCYASWDAQTHLIKIGETRVFNPSINVDEPAPADLFAAPVKTAAELLLFDAKASALKRIKVLGQVVHERAGEYYLMNGTNGLRVFPKTPVALTLGDRVEVVGFPELGGASPVLREAIMRKTGAAALPRAEPLTANTLLSADHDATLVQVVSQLVGMRASQTEQVLELQTGARTYLARLDTRNGLAPQITLGSRLQLTGVYAGQGGDRAAGRSIDSFELLLNSPADVKVLKRPPWWTLGHTLVVVGALVGVLLLAFAWISGLRRQVNLKTRQLQDEIEERKQAEETLRQAHNELEKRVAERTVELSQERRLMRTLIDNLPDCIYAKDAAGRKILANPADLINLRRKTEAEAIGMSDFEVFPPDMAEKFWADDQKVLHGEPVMSREELTVNDKGEKHWQLTTKLPLRDQNGKIVGLVGIGRNITEQKQAEKALRQSRDELEKRVAERTAELAGANTTLQQQIAERERIEQVLDRERLLLRTLIDNLPDCIYAKDAAGRKILANPADLKNLRCKTEAEAIGKSDFDFFPKDIAEQFWADDQKVIQGQPVINREEFFLDEKGEKRWLLTSKLPLRDQTGKIVGLMGIGRDVTERKQAEEALRRSQEEFKDLFDNAPVGFHEMDAEGRLVRINNTELKMLGYSAEELLGQFIWKISAEEETSHRATLAKLGGEPSPQAFGRMFRRKDGSIFPVLINDRILKGADGAIVGIRSAIQDDTDRQRAEESLRQNEERLLKVMMQTRCVLSFGHVEGPAGWREQALHPESPFRWDFPVQNVEAAQKIFPLELAAGEQYQQAWTRRCNRADHVQMNWNSGNAFLNDLPFYRNEFQCTDKNGVGHWMQQFVTVRKLAENRWQVFGVTTDISDLKRVEAELRWSETQLQVILESTADGILAVASNGKVIKTNRRFAELWRIPQSLMDAGDDRALLDFVLEQLSDPDAFLKKVQLLYGTDAVDMDILAFKDDRIFERYSFPMMMEGAVIGRVWSFRDITERKRQEEELKQKNAELERFTYTVSHDLKSPLVTVKTFLGYLEQDLARPDLERVKQDVAYMHTATKKMGQLLDELLNLARVGRKENPAVRVTFRELAQEAVRLVAGRISAGGVKVQVADAVVTLEGDRPRLMEIWQNLVENACKFMGNQPRPQVEIGVEQRGPETVFFVRDNGAGIDPRFQAKVFGLFEQLDPKGEGTGMGLALVKRIVDLYKGRIWVESAGLGQGANFLFTLPGAVILDPEQSS
jgi:PAS domain S-box-containing protein